MKPIQSNTESHTLSSKGFNGYCVCKETFTQYWPCRVPSLCLVTFFCVLIICVTLTWLVHKCIYIHNKFIIRQKETMQIQNVVWKFGGLGKWVIYWDFLHIQKRWRENKIADQLQMLFSLICSLFLIWLCFVCLCCLFMCLCVHVCALV